MKTQTLTPVMEARLKEFPLIMKEWERFVENVVTPTNKEYDIPISPEDFLIDSMQKAYEEGRKEEKKHCQCLATQVTIELFDLMDSLSKTKNNACIPVHGYDGLVNLISSFNWGIGKAFKVTDDMIESTRKSYKGKFFKRLKEAVNNSLKEKE